jgi:hypothetical protein
MKKDKINKMRIEDLEATIIKYGDEKTKLKDELKKLQAKHEAQIKELQDKLASQANDNQDTGSSN